MRAPILSGISADNDPRFRSKYPCNMTPVPKATGISEGYLKPAFGIVANGEGSGAGRGGIYWRDQLYRVMGSKLVVISEGGDIIEIGDVGAGGPVTMVYGFDYLTVASNGNLFHYDGSSLRQVTDPDLGTVLDVVWVDSYYLTTDGEFIVAAELNNPFSVLPTKYTSSEANPDPINSLLKLRNEVYALNRYTIEVFDNVGGSGFPFRRIEGAQIQKGSLGTHTACEFSEAIAFLGSGENESPSIYVAVSAKATKIATAEIDQILQSYTEDELEGAVLESRLDRGHVELLVHLPRGTLVYDAAASAVLQTPVWSCLHSGITDDSQYLGTGQVWAYGRWNVQDPKSCCIGYLTDEVSSHWGNHISWSFSTPIVYNEGRGVILHEIELVALNGRAALGDDPRISMTYSLDGVTQDQDDTIRAGERGERMKRLIWLSGVNFDQFCTLSFKGTTDVHASFSALTMREEPLAW